MVKQGEAEGNLRIAFREVGREAWHNPLMVQLTLRSNPLRGALILGVYVSALAAPILMSASHYALEDRSNQVESADAPLQESHLATCLDFMASHVQKLQSDRVCNDEEWDQGMDDNGDEGLHARSRNIYDTRHRPSANLGRQIMDNVASLEIQLEDIHRAIAYHTKQAEKYERLAREREEMESAEDALNNLKHGHIWLVAWPALFFMHHLSTITKSPSELVAYPVYPSNPLAVFRGSSSSPFHGNSLKVEEEGETGMVGIAAIIWALEHETRLTHQCRISRRESNSLRSVKAEVWMLKLKLEELSTETPSNNDFNMPQSPSSSNLADFLIQSIVYKSTAYTETGHLPLTILRQLVTLGLGSSIVL
ncbi:hypothetical protein EV360DRAFT_74959 [Lentinula raphanica]|nr:hypothetical protein EV360DRAFT_74959 [Lentinula raphanica]